MRVYQMIVENDKANVSGNAFRDVLILTDTK